MPTAMRRPSQRRRRPDWTEKEQPAEHLARELQTLSSKYGEEIMMEFRFARPIKRMWRADFAVIRRRILIEVEGGTTPFRDRRTGELRVGGHSTIEGYAKDCLKYNAATLLGYRVLRFTSAQVFDGTALETITQALNTFPAEEMPATVSEAAKPRPKRTRRPRQRSQPPAELAAAAPTRTA